MAPKVSQSPLLTLPKASTNLDLNFHWCLITFCCLHDLKMLPKSIKNQSKINQNRMSLPVHIFHRFPSDFSWIQRPAKPRKSLIFIANSSKIECSTFWFLCSSQDWFPINFMSILASKTLPKRIKVQLVFCIDFWNGFVQILAPI